MKLSNHSLHLLPGSTGLMTGGVVTINVTTSLFDITAGTVRFVDNTTNPLNPVAYLVSFAAQTGVAVTGLATQDGTFLGINTSGTLLQSATAWEFNLTRDVVPIAFLFHASNTSIRSVLSMGMFGADTGGRLNDLLHAIGVINVDGNTYSAHGVNLSINKAAGKSHTPGANIYTDKKAPDTTTDPAITLCSFQRTYRSGTGDFIVATATVITPDLYDIGTGTLAAVPATKWTAWPVYFVPGLGSSGVRVQYPQQYFNFQAEAEASVPSSSFVVNPNLDDNASVRTWIIVQQGCTDLSDTTKASFVHASKFDGDAPRAAFRAVGINGQLIYNNNGSLDGTDKATYDSVLDELTLSAKVLVSLNGQSPTTLTNPTIQATNSVSGYTQIALQNKANHASASADLIAYPDNVTVDATGFVDIGITSSVFADALYAVTGPNDAYLFGSAPTASGKAGNLVIATDSTGTANDIVFCTDGFNNVNNERLRISNTAVTIKPNTTVTGTIAASNLSGTNTGDQTTIANLSGGLGGQIPYQSAVNTTALLANGTAGQVLRSNGTTLAPSWVSLAGGGDMLAANNLSDVVSAVSARNNILPSKTGNTLKVLRVNAGETDYELVTLAGGGDVVGPASSVTGRVVTFNGTTGKLIQDSGLTLSGSNTGDQTITLTSDVTGSGVGSFATTIAAGAVTLAKMANVDTATVFYRKTAAIGAPEVQTLATLKTDLGLTGTNSGDQTSIAGITGTIAQFNTACTDADFATGGGSATGTNTGDQTVIANLSGGLGGSIPYQTAVNATAMLANGTSGQLLRSNGTTLAPSWVTFAGGGDVTGDDVTTTVQNIVAYATTGGKNITELTGTAGDMLYHNGTNWAKLAKGTASQRLSMNAGATAPEWQTVSAGGGPTYQALAADAATNSTTTFATVMATTISATGTYAFKYYVRYQAAALTTGVKFQFTFSGTTSTFTSTSRYQTIGGAAAVGGADQATTTVFQLIEGWSVRAVGQPLGPSISVDTANADMLIIIEGLMIVTGTGTFNLQHASEVAAASTVKAGTSLILDKIA